MQAQVKRYNVVIRGKVQDIGFRDLIAQMADFLGLKGYVFNGVDGSVRLIIEGLENAVDDFLEDIKKKTSNVGAEIEELSKREILRDSDLPPRFVKIPSTELEEIGRKFDIGVALLSSMDKRLGTMGKKLDKLDTIDSKLGKLDTIDKKLGELDKLSKLDTLVGGQEKMLKVLEKIEDKLG